MAPVPQAQEHPQPVEGEEQYYGEYYDQMNEDGDEITGALRQTRQNKKRVADDAKLLANRIALLKMEEKKAWKKI